MMRISRQKTGKYLKNTLLICLYAVLALAGILGSLIQEHPYMIIVEIMVTLMCPLYVLLQALEHGTPGGEWKGLLYFAKAYIIVFTAVFIMSCIAVRETPEYGPYMMFVSGSAAAALAMLLSIYFIRASYSEDERNVQDDNIRREDNARKENKNTRNSG